MGTTLGIAKVKIVKSGRHIHVQKKFKVRPLHKPTEIRDPVRNVQFLTNFIINIDLPMSTCQNYILFISRLLTSVLASMQQFTTERKKNHIILFEIPYTKSFKVYGTEQIHIL